MAGPLSQFPVSSPSPTLRLNIDSWIKVVRLHLLFFRTLMLVCQRNKLLLVFWFSNTILNPSCPEEETWYGQVRYTPVVSYAKGKTLKHDEPSSLHKIMKLKCSMKVLGYGMWNVILMSRGDTWISRCCTSIYRCQIWTYNDKARISDTLADDIHRWHIGWGNYNIVLKNSNFPSWDLNFV